MNANIRFLIGVDGGGSGTRVVVAKPNDLQIIASAEGPPSALGQGIEKAWRSILNTMAQAFAEIHCSIPMVSECAIGLGLSGANNVVWKNEFYFRNPGFKQILVDTDGYTTLLGAHAGKPGVIVAIGTGSVGMALRPSGERQDISGWGYPSGDEASGAWLGLKAASLTQKAFDGRRKSSALTDAVKNRCGKTPSEFLHWLTTANQNTFATLAPLIFEQAPNDPAAQQLLQMAGLEMAEMVQTLDPDSLLPLSICGRLGEALIPFLPETTRQRHQPAKSPSAEGALHLLERELGQ